MSTTDRVQSVRNAWINRVRDEALRIRRPEVSKCFSVGVIIATYADADGGNAFPSAATIAAVAGCTEETVTRCVKVLTAVGLLKRKRRPNQSAVYQLLIPVQRPEWEAHLHLYTDTRQARRKKELKTKEITESLAAQATEDSRTPFCNGIRTPFPVGVPEPVPAGGSEESGTRSGTVPEPVPQRGPEPVPAGGYQYTPTSGRDPDTDQNVIGPVPQPQVGAGARGNDDRSSRAEDSRPFGRCANPECGIPLLRADRTLCHGCEQRAQGMDQEPAKPVQSAIPMALPSAPDPAARGSRKPTPWGRDDHSEPLRICGCGRNYHARKPGRCPDCLAVGQSERTSTA